MSEGQYVSAQAKGDHIYVWGNEMPYSEVCMHLGIAGKRRNVMLFPGVNGAWRAEVSRKGSSHTDRMTAGEAGFSNMEELARKTGFGRDSFQLEHLIGAYSSQPGVWVLVAIKDGTTYTETIVKHDNLPPASMGQEPTSNNGHVILRDAKAAGHRVVTE